MVKRGEGVHTVPAPGWLNKVDGRIRSRHTRKEDAIEAGRAIARKLRVEHTIHNMDGTIAEKNSYGNDPFPPAG
jgi:hypothetical protein